MERSGGEFGIDKPGETNLWNSLKALLIFGAPAILALAIWAVKTWVLP